MGMTLEHVTIDCADPQGLAAWWAEAVGGAVTDDWGDFVRVDAGAVDVRRFGFQRVPEPKAGKNRVHLDFQVTDPAAEVGRLLGLGATRIRDASTGPMRWTVLADPAGNEFRVCECA